MGLSRWGKKAESVMQPTTQPSVPTSSAADYVSKYVAEQEHEITSELIAEGLQTLLERERLLGHRTFWVHVHHDPKYHGYDVEVRLAGEVQRVVSAHALLPDSAVVEYTDNKTRWAAYMNVFVMGDIMPAVRKILLDEFSAAAASAPWRQEPVVYEFGSYKPIRLSDC